MAGILPEGVMKLEGKDMGNVECIDNAYLVIEDGIITEYGSCGAEVSLKNNPSHSFIVGPSPCGQGGSTVFQTATTSCFVKLQQLQLGDSDSGSADELLGSLVESLTLFVKLAGKFIGTYSIYRFC